MAFFLGYDQKLLEARGTMAGLSFMALWNDKVSRERGTCEAGSVESQVITNGCSSAYLPSDRWDNIRATNVLTAGAAPSVTMDWLLVVGTPLPPEGKPHSSIPHRKTISDWREIAHQNHCLILKVSCWRKTLARNLPFQSFRSAWIILPFTMSVPWRDDYYQHLNVTPATMI